jgi:hypothetical protein
LRYREILVQVSIFLANPISKLLWASQKNSKDDQKILYIKEINPKLRLIRIVNGGRRIYRECALGRGRVDILVEYRNQWIVLELKIYRSAKTVEEGLEQTAEYMKTKGATEGHLIIFDRSDKSWDSKIYQETKKVGTLTINVWGL